MAWQAVVDAVGDVYYEIGYLEAASAQKEGNILLCLYEGDGGSVIYPIVLRPLRSLPFAARSFSNWFDVISPYEYGGPLVYASDGKARKSLQDGFCRAFAAYCQHHRIVSEFVRFHPLLHTQNGWGSFYEVRESCQNVVVDLRMDVAQILAAYSNSTRRNVRLAVKRGVRVEKKHLTEATLRDFTDIYYQTMDRVNATQYYYFPAEYFERLSSLGEGFISLYVATDRSGSPLSAALFLHSPRHAHYHLSGTLAGARNLYSNNLLLHTVVNDMRTEGRYYLHLGGASPSQRALLEFKRGFSSRSVSYCVGQRICNREVYDGICALSTAADPERAERGAGGFFPAYRRSCPTEHLDRGETA